VLEPALVVVPAIMLATDVETMGVPRLVTVTAPDEVVPVDDVPDEDPVATVVAPATDGLCCEHAAPPSTVMIDHATTRRADPLCIEAS
jgi:hypothetical protein